MKKLKQILFFADGSKGEKKALTSALELASHASAELSVIAYVQAVSSNDPGLRKAITEVQSSIIRERSEALNAMLADVDASKVRVTVEPAEKSFVSLIRKVVDEKFDLVVKAADKRGAIGNAIFGSLDQRLLRQCPAPVWLIKPGQRRIRKVLASVDLSTDDKKTTALAKRIVEFAQGIASIEQAELHVLTVWDQHAGAAFRRQLDASIYDRLMASLKLEIADRFSKLLSKVDGVQEHFLRGEPDQVIGRFVSKQDIDLVVMGTLSRSGVPGLLIGNTAERVLGDVDCSVLTLKPAGFKTVLAKGK